MAVLSRVVTPAAWLMALLLAAHGPAARAFTFPATWVGGSGDWIALKPGDWAIVDFSNPWKFFPDNSGSEYFLAFIPSGHVHLDAGVVPGELGVPVPFAGVSVSTLALDTNAELTIGGSGSLTVNGIEGVGSLITNLGRIVLADSASLSAPFALPILGSGELVLQSDNALLGGLGVITHDAAHTMSGFGTIASSLFINDGTVLADAPGKTLRFTGAEFINGGTLKAGGRPSGAPGGELRLAPLLDFVNDGQTIAANGLVKIESTDIDNHGTLGAEALGTVVLEDVAVDNGGTLFVEAGGAFHLRGDNLLSGGQLDAALGTRFTVSGGVTEMTGGITLSGELAADGGTLRFRNVDLAMHDGTVHLTAGTLATALVNNVFHGGRWTGSGELDVSTSSVWDAVSGMAIDDTTIKLFTGLHRWRGQLVNDGAIVLEETSFNSTLRFMVDGPTRFDGQGAVRVAVGDANRFEGGGADAELINGAGHTLAVTAGASATVDVALRNEGAITVDGAGASLLVQRDVRNAGRMAAGTGGTLRFSSPLVAGLAIDNAGGRIEAAAGGAVLFGDGHPLSSPTTLRGGVLAGPGILRGLNAMILDGATAGAITLEDGATLLRGGGTTTAFGTLINDGILKLEDTTGFLGGASRLMISGALTVAGSGDILLEGNSETLINGSDASARLLLGAGQRLLTAANTVGTLDVALENDGEVIGAGLNSTLLVQRAVTNRGVMAARNGGTLHFNPAATGIVIDNSAGRIEADLGASVLLGGGHPLSPAITLRGGTLAGAGILRGQTSLVLDGTTSGAITVEDGATLLRGGGTTVALGTLINNGVLKLEDTTGFLGGASRLAVSGALTVAGSGDILLEGNSETLINGSDASARLLLGAGQRLLTAANTVGTLDVALENDGEVIGAGLNSTLLVQRAVTNRGVMAARNGGTLHFNPAATGIVIDNSAGRIEADLGASVLLGGGHPLSPAITLRGGTLAGAGILRGQTSLVLDGTTSGAITVEDGATLLRGGGTTIALGTLINNGVLKLEDTTGFLGGASRLAISGALTVAGSGDILLEGNNETLINGSDASARLLLGAGQRLLTAANTVGTLDVALENDGEVIGAGLNSTLLVQRAVTNRGVMAARNGGTLHFNPAATGIVIDNSAGRIEADLGASVVLGGGHPLSPAITLRGGTLAGAGILRGQTSLVLDGTTSGAITLEDGATLLRGGGITIALGTLINHGTLALEDTTPFLSGNARLAVAGALQVEGTGRVSFTRGDEMIIDGTDASARLILGSGQTLSTQANAAGRVDVVLENHGRVQGNGANSRLQIQRNVINRGTLGAQTGSVVAFESSTAAAVVIDNHGGRLETAAGGVMQLGNGHPSAPFAHVLGGVIAGNGRVELVKTTLSEGVTIAPGFSAGTLTFGGNLNFDPTGALDIELGGRLAGTEYDRVVVTGGARLDGRLDIHLIDGFAPTDTDVFRILTAASVTGAFDNLDDGLVNFLGGSFEVVVGSGFVELRHFTAAPVPLPASAGLLAVAWLALVRRRRVQPCRD